MSTYYYGYFEFIDLDNFKKKVEECAAKLEETKHIHTVFDYENTKVVVTRTSENQYSIDPWDGEYWAGCNRWVNQGRNEYEPIGTATSMHECDTCDKLPSCKIKQFVPVWEWNEEIEKVMEQIWKSMNE